MPLLARSIENYLENVKNCLDRLDRKEIMDFLELLSQARSEGSAIFIMGNGGSAATASHFVCDFNKGVSAKGGAPFRFICLNDNVPCMMAYANDQDYADIFVGQLRNFLQPRDVVIGISGSGNSENVVRALEYANKKGAHTVALVGFDGGKLKKIASFCVHVEINNMQIVEDAHMVLDHLSMSLLGETCDQ